jgi:hypothetical protein
MPRRKSFTLLFLLCQIERIWQEFSEENVDRAKTSERIPLSLFLRSVQINPFIHDKHSSFGRFKTGLRRAFPNWLKYPIVAAD